MPSLLSPDAAARRLYAVTEYSDPFQVPEDVTPEDRARMYWLRTGTPRAWRARRWFNPASDTVGRTLREDRFRLVYPEVAIPGNVRRFALVDEYDGDGVAHARLVPAVTDRRLPARRRLVPVPRPALDNLANNASRSRREGEEQGRIRWRYALQSAAAELVPDERVAHCMRHHYSGGDGVDAWHVLGTGTGKITGVQTCGSVWMCPVCAARISEVRRRDLQEMVSRWRARGGKVVMITYTIRHQFNDSLQSLLDGLSRARRRFVSGAKAKRIRRDAGSIGSVRAFEVTYGRSGWHPHVHELHFVAGDCDVERFGRELWQGWKTAVDKCGLPSVNRKGFDVTECEGAVADYVSKWGHEPSEAWLKATGTNPWTEAHELTKQVSKCGRSETRLTPMQLLSAYAGRSRDQFAGLAWEEYARTMKGHRQLRTSNGLRDLLGMGAELTDEQIVEKREQEAVPLAHLTLEEWRTVVANDCRAELLELAGRADAAGIAKLVSDLMEMRASVRAEREAIERMIRGSDEVSCDR